MTVRYVGNAWSLGRDRTLRFVPGASAYRVCSASSRQMLYSPIGFLRDVSTTLVCILRETSQRSCPWDPSPSGLHLCFEHLDLFAQVLHLVLGHHLRADFQILDHVL